MVKNILYKLSFIISFRTNLIIVFSFLIILNTSLPAQIHEGEDLLVFKKDINDGLSQNIVISLELDNRGLLWIGTLDGLNVFDGHEFDEIGQYYELKGPYNDYYDIYSLPDGRICTKRDDGFHTIELKGKKWKQDSIMKQLRAICPISEDIVVINKNGELAYESDGYKWKSPGNCIDDLSNYNPVLRSNGQFFYALYTNGEVVQFDQNLNCVAAINLSEYGSRFVDLEFVDNKIWVISISGAFVELSEDLSSVSNMSTLFGDYQIERFTDLAISGGMAYILADQMGLFVYDLELKAWSHRMVRLLENPQGENEYIIRMIIDEDRLYFGSTTNGLLIYDKEQINFYNIPEQDFYNSTIYDLKLPRKIVEYGNEIWISTTGQGLWRYNKASRKTDHFTVESHPEFMSSNSITQIAFLNEELWIGYNGLGLEISDPVELKRKRKVNLSNAEIYKNIIINDIFQDTQGDVWLATEEHGIYIKTKNKTLHINSENSGYNLNKVYNIDRINDKVIISNFNGSIFEANEFDNSILKKETTLTDFTLKCILQDDIGNIWLGTGGQGIIMLDKNWNPIDTFSTSTGDMLSDEMCILLQDELHNIWAGTNRGLVHFVQEDGEYRKDRIFLQDDGLKANEFMTGAYLNDSEGNLWMGNIDGVNYWQAKEIQKSNEQFSIYLKKVYTINDHQEDVFEGDVIEDFNKRKDLNFEFGTIGFSAQNNIKYRVKLAGLEDDWKLLGNRNFVNYNNLQSGAYTFQIQATNYDGVWNDSVSSWEFEIHQKFYEKWWFYLFLLLIVTGLYIYGARLYSHYKVDQAAKRSEQERELLKMEMRALRAQINPHFLFNTLSSINNFILKNERTIASQFLVKFARLIRLILNYNSKRTISLEEELSALELYIELEQMRLGESFDYFINTEIEYSLSDISIPPLILQPFVENAIWHGLMMKEGDQILELDFIQNEDRLEISIRDNGIGREKASKKREIEKTRSYGIDITNKRLDLWLSEFEKSASVNIIDLKDNENGSLGTEVVIKIPIIQVIPNPQNA